MTNKKREYICAYCGKHFIDYTYRQRKYCSKECYLKTKRNKVTLTCEYCGKPYQVVRSRVGRSHFCSRSCKAKAQRNLPVLRGPEHPLWQGPVTVRCAYCGKEFQVSRRHYNLNMKRGLTRFYCSKDCLRANLSRLRKSRGHPPVEVVCARCGKKFTVSWKLYQQGMQRGQKRFFCSEACHHPGPAVVTCTQCGKPFQVERAHFNAKHKKQDHPRFFCSSECELQWRKQYFKGSQTPIGEVALPTTVMVRNLPKS